MPKKGKEEIEKRIWNMEILYKVSIISGIISLAYVGVLLICGIFIPSPDPVVIPMLLVYFLFVCITLVCWYLENRITPIEKLELIKEENNAVSL